MITGNKSDMELGTSSTASGRDDEAAMSVQWTFEQHVGMASGCKTDVTGSGTFTATPP